MTDTPQDPLHAITRRTLDHYDASAEQFFEGTREHDVRQNMAALLNAIGGAAPLEILDLGCGPGRDLKAFTELGHHATGVDGSARFVEMARAWSGCTVWQQDFLDLDLPAGRFDGVFANAVLFHVPSSALPGVLRALHGCLKAGRGAVQLESARPQPGRLERRPLWQLLRSRHLDRARAGGRFYLARPLLPSAGLAARAAAMAGHRLAQG